MIRRVVRDSARFYSRDWWYIALVQLIAGLAVAFPLYLMTQAATAVVTTQGATLLAGVQVGTLTTLFLALCLLVVAPLAMVGIASTVRIVNDGLAGRQRRLGATLLEGFRRMPEMLGSVLIAAIGGVVLIVLSPVLTALGILALVATALVVLVRRTRPGFAPRWPEVSLLAWIAMPFGLAVRFLAAALLAIPAVVLEKHGPVAALRAGADAARRRRVLVIALLIAGVLLSFALQAGAAGLGSLIGDGPGVLLGQVLVQLFLVGLPAVIATILFRLGRAESSIGALPLSPTEPYATRESQLPRRHRARPASAIPAVVQRVAIALPAILIITGVGIAPTAAQAAAPTVTVTVTTAQDTLDQTVLATQAAACESGSGTCSLRAALQHASALAGAGDTTAVSIRFADSYAISLAGAPLSFADLGGSGEEGPGETPPGETAPGDETPGGETPPGEESGGGSGESSEGGSGSRGTVTIDGGTRGVSIDARGESQVLTFGSNTWGLSLANLHISNGLATGPDALGGGVSIVSPMVSTIDTVTFEGNTAAIGGGAVAALNGNLTISDSTFSGNTATPGTRSDYIGGGGDVYALYAATVTILNSTFAEYTGDSILSASSTSTVRVANSLFDVRGATSARACNGQGFDGVSNVVVGSDTSCPGTTTTAGPVLADLRSPATGGLPVMALVQKATNGAVRAAGNSTEPCLADDARGRTRPAVGCDAGALQLDSSTTTGLVSSSPTVDFGTDVTFTASVALTDGATTVDDGTVTFTVDGIQIGTPVAVRAGSAAITTRFTDASGTRAVLATYTPVDTALISGSVSSPVSQTVIAATSGTQLTSSANPSQAGVAATVTATVLPNNPRVEPTGRVELRDRTGGGAGTLLETRTLSGGTAIFSIAQLAPGRHDLVAVYAGDAGNSPSESAVLQQVVQNTSAPVLRVSDASIDFGQAVDATVTVPTTPGLRGATGQVFISWSGGSDVVVLDGSGVARLRISDIAVGTSEVRAAYRGDDVYREADAAPVSVTVAETATTTALTGPAGLAYGAPAQLTATVSRVDGAAPTGRVEFLDGTTTLGTVALTTGSSTTSTAVLALTAPQLAVGARSVTARFVPTGGYSASASTTLSIAVSRAGTSAALTSSAPRAAVGATTILTAVVSAGGGSLATPSGDVEFLAGTTSLGTVPLAAGVARLDTAFASVGTRELTVRFVGSESFSASTSPALTQTTGSDAVTTRLSVSPSASSTFGTALRVTVTVLGATSGLPGTGTVTVRDGSTLVATIPLARGTGTTTIPAPATGDHAYQATFAPANDDFLAGTSELIAHTVGQAGTTTVLDISNTIPTSGDPVRLTATVSSTTGAATGSVVFATGGQTLGTAQLVEGVAMLSAGLPQSADLPGGERWVSATYVPADGFTASSTGRFVRVSPGTAEISVALRGTRAGEAQSLEATVRVLSGTGTPTGRIVFQDSRNDRTWGADLVGGVATATGVALAAGDHVITARLLPGDAEFGQPSPATATLSVSRGTPSVTVIADTTGSVAFGSSVRLTATVTSAGVAPTGSVRFTANGPSGRTDLGEAGLLRNSPYTATLTTTALPAGTQSITATYLGDADLNETVSPALVQEVGLTATRSTLTLTPTEPAPGNTIRLRATIAATGTVVGSGTVEFFRDGVSLGTSAVNGSGIAVFDYVPSVRGEAVFEARFTSPSGDFVGSTATASTTVVGHPVVVELAQPEMSTFVGMPSHFRVAVTDGGAGLSRKPTGTVTVTDGAGNTCVIAPAWDSTRERSTGDCLITWGSAAARTLRATYSGDSLYGSATSNPVVVTASARDAQLTLAARSALLVGQPTTLVWSVAGPVAGGAVRITDGTTEVCTSTAVSGTCEYTPTGGRSEATLTLTYTGTSSVWATRSTSLTLPVAGCVPLRSLSASPSNGGSISVVTPPNCGVDGYRPGTYVEMKAVPASGWTFSKWLVQDSDLPDTLPTSYVRVTGPGITQGATFAPQCVNVTFTTIGALNNAYELTRGVTPACAGWTGNGVDKRSDTGQFQVGSVISLTAQAPSPDASGAVKVFSGWIDSAVAPTGVMDPRRDYVVTSALDQEITARFAEECVHDITVVQPSGGTISLDGPRCVDGIGEGFPLGAQLSVSTKGTGTAYFAQWDGPVRQLTSAAGGATGTVRVAKTNSPISATYRECLSFTATVAGYAPASGIDPSTVRVSPVGTCPNKGAGWYVQGSRVQLETTGARGTTFSGWTSTLDFGGSERNASTSVVIQQSGTAEAMWFSEYFCKPFDIEAVPAGALTISAALAPGLDKRCPAGMVDASMNTNGSQPLTLTAKANDGDPMVGWTGQSTRLDIDGIAKSIKIAASAAPVRTVEIASGGVFTAWACQAITTTLTMISPDGTRNSTPLPTGTDYVAASPAPDCPLAQSAYTLGQTVFPQALGDDAGHAFVGWSGAVDSTDAYSSQGIVIDGSTPTIALTATYQVKCFTLTTNPQHTEVMDAPNCPDTPASENKYVGGTTISFKTIGNAGTKVFRGFTGDFDAQDGIYAWVTITKDSAVYSNYENRSAGEAIGNALSEAGNAVAIAAKKAVGMVAAVVSAITIGGNPLVMAMSLVVLIGQGVGAFADAVGLKTDGMARFNSGISGLSQVVGFMQATALCGSVWAANGSVKTVDDLDSSASKKVGDYAAKVYEAKKALEESRKAQQAAQLAAIDAAGDSMAAMKWASKTDETTSTLQKLANKISGTGSGVATKASSAYQSAKSAASKAGRLGDVAMVGYAVYSDYQNGNSGWDESAESAWTTGGDVYMQCMDNAAPDFLKNYDGS